MHSRFPLLTLALLLSGCAAQRRDPAAGTDTLAAILRAEDRRLVDDALRGALSGVDDVLRARAVRALGRMRLPSERLGLEAALADPAPAVRREAARALALLADPGSLPALTSAVKDEDAEVRASVLEALGLVAASAGSDAVRAGLADHDPRVAKAAALAVWRLSDGLQAVGALAAAAGSGSARAAAGRGLCPGTHGGRRLRPHLLGKHAAGAERDARAEARDALLALARDRDPEVRMQVARGLAQPGRPAEMGVLETLAADVEARVRVHAARSLVGEGITLGPAFGRLLRDGDLLVAQAAIESLGRVRTPEAKEILLAAMAEGPEWLAAVALDTLAGFDAPAAADVAAPLATAPSARLRAAVARALGAQMPAELLADPDLGVRTAAVSALATADPFDPRLTPFASGDDPLLRASLAEALGSKMDGTDQRPCAVGARGALAAEPERTETPDARDAVLDAAGKAGRDPAAHALLEAGLSDREWLVRRRAAEVLGRVYEENRTDAVGAASAHPVAHYAAALRWAAAPHRAVFRLKEASFEAELACEQAPLTCLNFACLANAGFYDGHQVHRVVPSFVVQDGDPRGDGSGGPGYAIRDEVGMAFAPGVLGMASAG